MRFDQGKKKQAEKNNRWHPVIVQSRIKVYDVGIDLVSIFVHLERVEMNVLVGCVGEETGIVLPLFLGFALFLLVRGRGSDLVPQTGQGIGLSGRLELHLQPRSPTLAPCPLSPPEGTLLLDGGSNTGGTVLAAEPGVEKSSPGWRQNPPRGRGP